MKLMKYIAFTALATGLSQGAIMASDATSTPTPTNKSAAQQLKDHKEQQRKDGLKNKTAQSKVDAKLKEQAAEKREHEADHRKSLAAMRAKHVEEKQALTASHKKAMEELIAKQKEEIAEATKGHEEHLTQLSTQHEAAAQKKIQKHLVGTQQVGTPK